MHLQLRFFSHDFVFYKVLLSYLDDRDLKNAYLENLVMGEEDVEASEPDFRGDK